MDVKRVAWNVFWNWSGMALFVISGFVLSPFLVGRLGETTYGLWILIGSLTSYFGMLDLGVRGSVGRYVAFYHAKNDQEGVNATVSTALAILCIPAILTMLGTAGALTLFFELFEVPADQVASVKLAMLLVGINLAVSLPLTVFEGTLWGRQRFDLINAIDMPTVLIRVALTFYFVAQGYGLVSLGVINLATTLVNGLARIIISFRVDRGLRIGRRLVRKTIGLELFSFGLWSLLLVVAGMITAQMSPLIIGNQISVQLVTIYSLVLRLVDTARSVLIASTGVLTPVSTALHAEQSQLRQRRLFVEGGKYCYVFALFFMAIFVFLGEPLLTLWIGPSLNDPAGVAVAFELLVVLAIGQVLPLSQWITHGVLLGINRHRFMALVGIAESIAAPILALACFPEFGFMGVCVAFLACEVFCRGLVKFVYACRLVHVPVTQYVLQVFLVPLAPAALPILGLAMLRAIWTPDTWFLLVLHTAIFTAFFTLCCTIFLVGWERVRAILGEIGERFFVPTKTIEGESA